MLNYKETSLQGVNYKETSVGLYFIQCVHLNAGLFISTAHYDYYCYKQQLLLLLHNTT